MGFLKQKTEDQKQADALAKAERQEADAAAKAERDEADRLERARIAAYQAALPCFEYQVKRVGEDKQKGILGSQRMEQIFNVEGKQGWELVTINEERATFRRQLPPRA